MESAEPTWCRDCRSPQESSYFSYLQMQSEDPGIFAMRLFPSNFRDYTLFFFGFGNIVESVDSYTLTHVVE